MAEIQDIHEAVCCHPGITGHKVRFEGFGNYALEFLVLFHVGSFDDRWSVITDANMEVLRRVETHGVRLAGPMQVNLRTDGRSPVVPVMDETAARNDAAAAAGETELSVSTLPQ
jgi:small-conductance mechanosensitive channel